MADWADTTFCSLKTSWRSCRSNRPRLLTQAPRLVETVTSGQVATMRAARSLSPLVSSARTQLDPSCLLIHSVIETSRRSGTGMNPVDQRHHAALRLVGQALQAY